MFLQVLQLCGTLAVGIVAIVATFAGIRAGNRFLDRQLKTPEHVPDDQPIILPHVEDTRRPTARG